MKVFLKTSCTRRVRSRKKRVLSQCSHFNQCGLLEKIKKWRLPTEGDNPRDSHVPLTARRWPTDSTTGRCSILIHHSYHKFATHSSTFMAGACCPAKMTSIGFLNTMMYSLWRSTYWVVKHRVRDTNWSFRWLWRLSSVSITEDWALFVRRTFIFLWIPWCNTHRAHSF